MERQISNHLKKGNVISCQLAMSEAAVDLERREWMRCCQLWQVGIKRRNRCKFILRAHLKVSVRKWCATQANLTAGTLAHTHTGTLCPCVCVRLLACMRVFAFILLIHLIETHKLAAMMSNPKVCKHTCTRSPIKSASNVNAVCIYECVCTCVLKITSILLYEYVNL